MPSSCARRVVLAILVGLLGTGGVASAAAVTAGWAPGGTPWTSQSDQVTQDAQTARSDECGENSALLFRVRGSGASYGAGVASGQDRLGRWSRAASEALIDKGWRVRDMQALYDAPPVPLAQISADFKRAAEAPLPRRPAALVRAARRAVVVLKAFRAVATREWPVVRDQLAAAAARCRARRILVAGYSQGGIVLRSVLTHLDARTRGQIAHVDLIADPTADNHVDAAIPHASRGLTRLTREGIDTFAARLLQPDAFHQAALPQAIALRTTQVCELYDLVCDANLVSFARAGGEVARHTSYPWGAVGEHAAGALRRWPRIGIEHALAGVPQAGKLLGSPTAPVVVHEFIDFQCPFCRESVLDALPSLIARYVRTGEVQLILEPVAFIGTDSVKAARYAVAAGMQDRMWTFTARFLERQGEENSGYVTAAFLRRVAARVPGLDPVAASAAARSSAIETALSQSQELWTHAGLSGVPSFVIGRTGGPLRTVSLVSLGPGPLQTPIARLLDAGS